MFSLPAHAGVQPSRMIALLGALTLAAAALVSAAPARAEDLIVKFDQSQILRLPRPAAEIIIGNPAVADVAIQSGNMLVITGKSYGLTNIIALDAERQVIQDQRVMVRRDESRVVQVYKAGNRQTYNCSPQCNPSLMPGDDEKYFSNIRQQSESKIQFSQRAAEQAGTTGSGD